MSDARSLPNKSLDRTAEVLRSGRFDKLSVRQARALIDSAAVLDRVPVTERYYFGCGDGAGHRFYGNHNKGMYSERTRHNELVEKIGFGEVDGALAPSRSHTWGSAMLSHSPRGWTALGFWDNTGDSRPGSNSVFFADQRLSWDEMLADAQENWPRLFARLTFPVTEAAHA